MFLSTLHSHKTEDIPYTDMVKWIIDMVIILDREFKNSGQEVMRYFSPYSLRLMYNLPEPQKLYNKHFLEKFSKENEDPKNVMRTWTEKEKKIKKDKMGMYSTTSISPPYTFVAAMQCRLFNKPDSTNFFPIMAAINCSSCKHNNNKLGPNFM